MQISIKELLKIGWQKTKENLWFLIGFQIVLYAVSILGSGTDLSFFISIAVSFVLAGVFLRVSRGEKVSFGNLFEGLSFKRFLHLILATIIITIMIALGFVLLIVPGIIVAIATAFVTYILIDEKKITLDKPAFWTAIKKSAAITKGRRSKIFMFFLAVVGINILGIIALGVGLLVTGAITAVAMATLYDKLISQPAEAKGPESGNVLPAEAS